MINRPDLYDGGNQYENHSDQFNNRDEEIAMVRENFDMRRRHSGEGYEVKLGVNNEYVNEWVVIQEHSNPLHEEKDVRQMLVPIHISFERGFYVYWLNEPWIVFSEKRYIDGGYWVVQIRKCNYLMKWIDTYTKQIVEHWVVLMNKNSYSPGVWSNTFAQYVDGEISCVIPSFSLSVKRSKRDDRRLISSNEIYPKSYRISNIRDVIMEGCTVWNFEEDEPSPTFDDYENMIADRWKYEFIYEINVLNGEKFSVGITQSSQLLVKIRAINKLYNSEINVDSPNLLYESTNKDILDVLEDGTILPVDIGSALVDIKLMSNDTGSASIIASKRIEISITNQNNDRKIINIQGDNLIYFDKKSKYTASILKNGLIVDETFDFQLVNELNFPLSKKIAQIVNITSTTCEIQCYAISATIRLVTKASTDGLENTKEIIIKDII